MCADYLTSFAVVWWRKIGRGASKKLRISGLVSRKGVPVEKRGGDVEIECDEIQFVNGGMCLARSESEGAVSSVGCACVCVAVCVRGLTITTECEACSDILVGLFANDQFERDKCGVLFDLVGSYNFERFVCFEHFLVFLVYGGIYFGRVQD